MPVCPRCEAALEDGTKVCAECGAPLVPGAIAEIPPEIHRELAKANLLRLRHDLDGAEKICLSVLKRFPNSQPTHTLLGDISDERGNLEDAERWYDLALELDPQSAGDRRKLEDVRMRRNATESASTVEQIGLPAKRPTPWPEILTGGFALVALVAIVMLAMSRNAPATKPQTVVTAPIVAPADAVPSPVGGTTPNEPAKPETTPVEPPVTTPTEPEVTPPPTGSGDETLMRLLAQRNPYGSTLIASQLDPREKTLTLTMALKASDDPRQIGADLGRTAMELDSEIQTITLRAITDGKLAFVADMTRARYAETLAPTWLQENPNPGAFAQYVLSNEWTPSMGDNSAPTVQP